MHIAITLAASLDLFLRLRLFVLRNSLLAKILGRLAIL
jgi:hypothetical protein